jgi:hypothetical protein
MFLHLFEDVHFKYTVRIITYVIKYLDKFSDTQYVLYFLGLLFR